MDYFPVEGQTWEYNNSWTPTGQVSDTLVLIDDTITVPHPEDRNAANPT